MIRIRTARFKSMVVPGFLAGILIGSASILSGCDSSSKDEWRPKTPSASTQADAAEAGYVAPPRVEQVAREASGLLLTGAGAPDASVRLGAPTGEIVTGKADAKGRWSLKVPYSPSVRLYGLSMTRGDRTVQAEGYVMVTPEGSVALLRAGSGAWRLSQPSASPRILAVDVDPEGGAVISGIATPGAGLSARIDRTPRAEGLVGEDGRFFLSLSEPLGPGAHDIQVSGEGGEQKITIVVSPAAPLTNGPVRAQRTPAGWRADWMTPGGGVQTTLLTQAASR
ncbi:hypothetical protein [Caulobacter sp.]|uniref:hypothetical protein n=1 Tax=Caulobacter sp. TaxID=78 RepID=UPI003BA8C3CD